MVDQQREWILDFVASPGGQRAARNEARRQGMSWTDADDLAQDWVAALLVTLNNAAAQGRQIPAVDDPETAARYALRALRNRARDHFRTKRYELVGLPEAEADPEIVLDLLANEATEDPGSNPQVPREWATAEAALDQIVVESLRLHLSGQLYGGTLRCNGCAPAVVISMALGLLDLWFDGTVPANSLFTQDGISGGMTEFDEAMYTALDAAQPGSVVFEGENIAARSRQKKRRCGSCVTQALAAALEYAGHEPATLSL